MDANIINSKMKSLEGLIKHHFNNIEWLAKAMKSVRVKVPNEGKNHKEYTNEGLATVGDTIIKFVLADYLYQHNVVFKGDITDRKQELENNSTLHNLVISEGIINYAYNDIHFYSDDNIADHEQVVSKGHDPYIEAIVGAIYYDSNFETAKKWILSWLQPKLSMYKVD